jgi:hypothetical protein
MTFSLSLDRRLATEAKTERSQQRERRRIVAKVRIKYIFFRLFRSFKKPE